MIAMPHRLGIARRAAAWRTYCLDGEADSCTAGWLDARRDFGAAADGITDDTVALERALDALGTDAVRVLHLPAGDYRITRTLQLVARQAVALFGEDASATTIVYDGADDQPMLRCIDARCVRIGHLTWDGRRRASAAVVHVWNTRPERCWIEHIDAGFRGLGDSLTGGLRLTMPGGIACFPPR